MLAELWTKWKRVAQRIGDFQARVILTIIYFLILGPIAMLMRLVSDPLKIAHRPRSSVWVARPVERPSLEGARRQS